MFEGFYSSIPGFMAPSLEVETVGMLVTQTVLSGESQVRFSSSNRVSMEPEKQFAEVKNGVYSISLNRFMLNSHPWREVYRIGFILSF